MSGANLVRQTAGTHQVITMSRGPATFRQRDVTAAIKAVECAGRRVARVEIERDGRIIVILRPAGDDAPLSDNEWDDILENPPVIHPRIQGQARADTPVFPAAGIGPHSLARRDGLRRVHGSLPSSAGWL
jgi:hypothetical protein